MSERPRCEGPGGSSKASQGACREQSLWVLLPHQEGAGRPCSRDRSTLQPPYRSYPKLRRAVARALSPWETPEEKHCPGCGRRWPSSQPRGHHQDLAQLPRSEPGLQAPRRRLQCCWRNSAPTEYTWAGARTALSLRCRPWNRMQRQLS